MGYRIGSFNIKDFSRNSVSVLSNRKKKDLNAIGEIIRSGNFDIVAIQEISNKEALKELLEIISKQYAEECKGDFLRRGNKEIDTYTVNERMGDSYGYRTKHWEGRWAPPKSNYGNNIAEGYAFIWNREKISLVKNSKGKVFEPRISDYKDSKELVRPPFVGRFMPVNGNYEFRLINTHIVYAKPSKKLNEETGSYEELQYVDMSDVTLRKKELEILVKSIYAYYSEQIYDVTGHDKNARLLVPYTFILGDYNLNLNNAKALNKSARIKDFDEFIFDIRGTKRVARHQQIVITVNDQLTTLRSNDDSYDGTIEEHLANNYDHFSYDVNRLKDHEIANPEVGALYTVFDLIEENEAEGKTKYNVYNESVSDHIPIYMDFDVRNRRR